MSPRRCPLVNRGRFGRVRRTTTDPVRLTTVTNRNTNSRVHHPTTCTVTALPGAPG